MLRQVVRFFRVRVQACGMWLSVIDIVHALEFCTMWCEMLNQRNRKYEIDSKFCV